MTKSNGIKMTYEQAKQLAGYLKVLRGHIDTLNRKVHPFKRSLSKENLKSFNGIIDGDRHVRRSLRDYVEGSVMINEEVITVLNMTEEALLDSNDQDKLDEFFGEK